MTYHIWKLRTGRRDCFSQPIDTSFILLSGAVGSFLVLFLLLIFFWFSCAYIFYADNPNPVQFTVAEDMVSVAGDYRKNQDYTWRSTKVSKEGITDPCWIDSWNEGMSVAKHRGQPVLVDLRCNDSYWSDRMDKDTLSSPEIRKRLDNGWVCIRIDLGRADKIGIFEGKTVTYRGMGRAFHVDGVPASLFIDSSGRPVQVVPGFIPKGIFGSLLDYMENRVYERNIPFKEYRTSLASGKR